MFRSASSIAASALGIMGACALSSTSARAQQTQPAQAPPMSMPMADSGTMQMTSSVDLLSPMTSEGSGTAWLPSSSPMYGKMLMSPNGNMLMLHGAATPRYTDTGSTRGDRRVDAPNWFMGMFSHPLDPSSQLGLRAMLSLDALTEGGAGYPLLFQTGETWHNEPLHDHQHPHDLFSELSTDYSRKVKENVSTFLYLGYPGEPALGPPTYMHRLIAYDLPDAPIGHHWQDATHITFGVATVGVDFANRWKFETSDFTGREPDQNRYNFERPRFDSYSGRVSYNLDARDAFQVSYGSITNPEGDGIQQHRITSSWIYNKPLGADANFTTTLVWGQNIIAGPDGRSNSFLEEADYQVGRNAFFTRWEQIQKSNSELVLPTAATDASALNGVGAYTVGYLHDLNHGKGIDTGVGGAVTVNTKSESLDAYYGRGTPVGFQVMIRFRPSRAKMDGSGGMAGMSGMGAKLGMNGMPGMSGMTGMADDKVAGAPVGKGTIILVTAPDKAVARQKAHVVATVLDGNGKPMTGVLVRAEANMTTMDMGAEKTDMTPVVGSGSAGKYEGDLTFTMAGPWRVTVTVESNDGKHTRLLVRDVDVTVIRQPVSP